jgi:hypothetical protein
MLRRQEYRPSVRTHNVSLHVSFAGSRSGPRSSDEDGSFASFVAIYAEYKPAVTRIMGSSFLALSQRRTSKPLITRITASSTTKSGCSLSTVPPSCPSVRLNCLEAPDP